MLEEVLDLVLRAVVQIAEILDVLVVVGGDLVGRHAQDLGIQAGFVFGAEHGYRTGLDHAAGHDRFGGEHQHVDRVAVVIQRLRHEAVVGRVVHGDVHETVDHEAVGVLVDFVLHRARTFHDLDDDVDFVRCFLARCDGFKAHCRPLSKVNNRICGDRL